MREKAGERMPISQDKKGQGHTEIELIVLVLGRNSAGTTIFC